MAGALHTLDKPLLCAHRLRARHHDAAKRSHTVLKAQLFKFGKIALYTAVNLGPRAVVIVSQMTAVAERHKIRAFKAALGIGTTGKGLCHHGQVNLVPLPPAVSE